MNHIQKILLAAILLVSQLSIGQTPSTPCYPSFSCDLSLPVCDLQQLDGISFRNDIPNAMNLGTWCTSIENIRFFKFRAAAPSIQIKFTPSDCSYLGIQASLYKDDCSFVNVLQCISPGVAIPIFLTANDLVINQNYVIAIDGYGGSVCDVAVEVLHYGALLTTLPTITAIAGPGIGIQENICPDAYTNYSTLPIAGAETYDWTLSPAIGTIIHPNPQSPSNEIFIQWNAFGTAQLCVTPRSTNSNAPAYYCETIVVNGSFGATNVNLPGLCPGECVDYNGFFTCATGQVPIIPFPKSRYNCDSIVLLNIPALVVGQSSTRDTLKCLQEFLLFAGDTIRSEGIYQKTLTSANFNGCDSMATLEVVDLRPSVSFGSSTVYCPGDTVMLSVTQFPGVQYTWSPTIAVSCDTCASTSVLPYPGQKITLMYESAECAFTQQTKLVPDCADVRDTIAIGTFNYKCLPDPLFPNSQWVDSCQDDDIAAIFNVLSPRCISYFGSQVGTDTLCFTANGPNNTSIQYTWYITVEGNGGFLGPRPAPTKPFTVYPNPAVREIFWKSTEPLSQIQLLNAQGQLLIEEKAIEVFGSLQVAHLPKGMYYLVGKGATSHFQQAIIIQ